MAQKKELDKSEIKEGFQQRLLELKALHLQTSKRKLTTAQRCRALNRIYDGTLIALEEAVMMGIRKGTASATTILERTRLEAVALQTVDNAHTHDKENEHVQHSMGYELELPEPQEPVEA